MKKPRIKKKFRIVQEIIDYLKSEGKEVTFENINRVNVSVVASGINPGNLSLHECQRLKFSTIHKYLREEYKPS